MSCHLYLYLGVIQNMEPHQDPSLLSSLQQLIEELENLMVLESSKNGTPWISITKLTELFYEKYEVSPEEVAKVQGYSDGLKSLFTSSRRFSIYATQIPQEFYVALLTAVVSGYNQNQTRPIQYRIKRPRKVDENLIRMLKNEGVEEIQSRQSQRISEYQPILLPEIKSVNDLEIVLMEIIKSLTMNYPKQFATVVTLSKKFRDHYGQPIRTVVRSVCPDIRIIDLLQTIPNLHVRKVDNNWQITLKIDSLE